jgi:hypothetical protein
MVHQTYDSRTFPARRVERDLVEILDHYVVSISGESFLEISTRVELERVPAPHAMNVDSIDVCARCAAGPSTGEKIYAMASGCDASKDFMKMDFGASAIRILSIVPVDDEYPH